MGDGKTEKMSYVTDGSASNRLLREDKNNPVHWDVLLCHENGEELKAHKALLSVNSGFFRTRFSPEWLEAGDNRVTFTKAEIDFESLDALVGSIYCDPFEIDAENVYEVHSAATFLEMEELSVKCAQFLVNTLGVENVWSTFRYSKRQFPGSDVLSAGCLDFIDGHFCQIYKLENFTELKFEEVKQIISRETLGVLNEVDVVDAVLIWIMAQWKERCEHNLKFLECVRWAQVDKMLIRKLECVDKLAEVECATDSERSMKLSMTEFLFAPQRAMSVFSHLGLAERRGTVMSSIHKSKMYIFEKPKNGQIKLKVQDLKSMFWESKSFFSQNESVQTMFIFMNQILAVSAAANSVGIRGLKVLILGEAGVLQRIKLIIPDGPNIEYCFCSMFFADSYLTIPLYGGSFLKAILVFDLGLLFDDNATVPCELTALHVVENIPSTTPRGVDFPLAIFLSDDLYVVGGSSGCGNVLIHNVVTRTWKEGSHIFANCCTSGAYLFEWSGTLYSAGGHHNEFQSCGWNFQFVNLAESDRRGEVWTKGPDLAKAARVCCHYVHEGRLYLVGWAWINNQLRRCVQSIPLDDFNAGWRDDTAHFAGTNPWFVGII